jgi:hypothetical protein
MNLFTTSSCPKKSAQFLDDKRLVKMCLETAQLLAQAVRLSGGVATYRISHQHHPVAKFTRSTKNNYLWVLGHFYHLCKEYTRRFKKEHGCEKYLNEFVTGLDFIPYGSLSPFPNCAANSSKGVSYKHVQDVHEAYRLYLSDRWTTDTYTPRWTKTGNVGVCNRVLL